MMSQRDVMKWLLKRNLVIWFYIVNVQYCNLLFFANLRKKLIFVFLVWIYENL